jgi:hypothetical protein
MTRWILSIAAFLAMITTVACSSSLSGSASGPGTLAVRGSLGEAVPSGFLSSEGSTTVSSSSSALTGQGGSQSGSGHTTSQSRSSKSLAASAPVALTGAVASAAWVQDSKASVLVNYQCTSSGATVLNLAWSYDGLGGNTSSAVTCNGKNAQVTVDTSDQIRWVDGSTIGIQDSFTSSGQTFGAGGTNFTVGEATDRSNDDTNAAGGFIIFGTLLTYTIDCVGPPGTSLTLKASAKYNGATYSIPSFTDTTCNGPQRHQDYVANPAGFPDGSSIEIDYFLATGSGGASPIFTATVSEP